MTFFLTSNKSLRYIITFFVLVLLLVPLLSFAQGKTNESKASQANQTGITYECGDGVTAGDCTFQDLLNAVKKVIDFGVRFTLFFSVVVITWAGYNLMISGDDPGKRKEARDMLWKVAKGIACILLAWLIVSLILNALKVDSSIKF